ncbi:tetratricopeptide repeat protein [Inhella crocodyli]|uniref:Tetratricopeptide repeat protein n=1 Tax=Inhella crocodyli TaxID=2499851 RepID=A0A3S2Y015_9BURK|nr:tetratricopeptide repeat protein [Inhella crocodyli]RVT88729.1 tetratricopeptide repeat protein [Inhella crocodyli]
MSLPPALQALRAQGLALQARLRQAQDPERAPLQAELDALQQRILALVLAPPPPRLPARLVAGCVAVVLAVGAAGYAWKGHPEAIDPAPPPDRTEEMVQRLAARLQQQPDDANGWAMLGRSYLVLGRPTESVTAYRRALALRPDDADLLADLADVLASHQGGSLEGEPARLLAHALAQQPEHLKTLALLGTLAYRQGDKATAIRHWERLQALAPAEHPLRQLADQGLAAARAP